MNNVVNFSDRLKAKNAVAPELERFTPENREERYQKRKKEMTEDYLNHVPGSDDMRKMDRDELISYFTSLIATGKNVVFRSEEEASQVGSILLTFPEFENVSHFEINPCVSRMMIFYKLYPILKDENIAYIVPDPEMTIAFNLEAISMVAMEIAEQEEEVQNVLNKHEE